jgi:glycosyltransferase involved in cell wall biosynthesis
LGASGHNRLLKILHIDPERGWGGGETQVLGLMNYLAARGHRNHLSAYPGGKLWQRSQRPDVAKFALVARNDLDVRPVWRLRRLIGSERYDIVHLHTKRAHALAAWLPHGGGAPRYLVTRRMDYPEKRNCRTRYLYNHCVHGIVAISRPIVDVLVAAGVDRDKIRLIHSGIDVDRFKAEGDVEGRNPTIGTLAVLEPRKGHRYLVEAIARLKARGLSLRCLFAGTGAERERLEDLATQFGVKAEVGFLGFVEDTPAFLAGIDIFILPSLHEGLGVSVLEAMAAGRPVVASRVGGLSEIVVDGKTGLLVPPADSAALSEAIAALIAEPGRARAMGQAAAAHARERFSLELMAARNEEYYFEVLDNHA